MKDDRITLVQDGKTISDECELAKLFNNCFGSIAKGIDLECPATSQEWNNSVENAIKICTNYPSIVKIKSIISPTQNFAFVFVNTDDIKQKFDSLDVSKVSQTLDIPTRLLKQNWWYFLGLSSLREKRRYSQFFQSKCEKIWTRKAPNTETSHAVLYSNINTNFEKSVFTEHWNMLT